MGPPRHVRCHFINNELFNLSNFTGARFWPICTHHQELNLHNAEGEVICVQKLPSVQFGAYSYNGHRGELHERLFTFAKSLGVEIRLGQDVTEYWEDEERGEAGVLSNGERLHADIVVGADA